MHLNFELPIQGIYIDDIKSITKKLFFVTLLFLTFSQLTGQSIIPKPTNLSLLGGQQTILSSNKIVYDNSSYAPIAQLLANELYRCHAITLSIQQSNSPAAGDIFIKTNNSLPGERYLLNVNSSIILEASSINGVFPGTVSIVQSITSNGNGSGTIPRMTIDDEPFRRFRSVMIDVKNLWYSPDDIKTFIKLARFYKIRYLSLHTGEKQWLAAVLNQTSGFSQAQRAAHHLYTKAEMDDLIQFGRQHGVYLFPHNESAAHHQHMLDAMKLDFNPNDGFAGFADEIDGLGSFEGFSGQESDTRFRNVLAEAHRRAIDQFKAGYPSGMKMPMYHIGPVVSEGGMSEDLANYFRGVIVGYDSNIKMSYWATPSVSGPLSAYKSQLIPVCYTKQFHATYANFLENNWSIVNAAWTPLYIVGTSIARPIDMVYNEWNYFRGGTDGIVGPIEYDNFAGINDNNVLGGLLATWENPASDNLSRLKLRLPAFSEHAWQHKSHPYPANDFSDYSNRIAVTDEVATLFISNAEPPGIPIGVAATDGLFTDKIRVAWQASSNGPTEYKLYRNTSNNSNTAIQIVTLSSTETVYEDTNVSNGTVYYYWVKAENNFGESGFSISNSGSTGSGGGLVNAYEPFDYGAGQNITGANQGSGWSNSWNIVSSNGTVNINNYGLTYPGLATSGNSLNLEPSTDTPTLVIERNTDGQIGAEGISTWVSFLVQVKEVRNGHMAVFANDNFQLGLIKKWGNGFLNTSAENGKTYFVVYQFESAPGNDVTRTWVDPVIGIIPSPSNTARVITDQDVGTNNKITINLQGYGQGRYDIDEIRVGTSFQDVMPPGDGPDPPIETDCDLCPNGSHETTSIKPQKSHLVTGQKRILFMRGQGVNTPYNASEADIEEFNTLANDYFMRNSYGKTSIADFDITPIYTIDLSQSFVQRSDALLALAGKQYNLSDYDVYVFNDPGDLGGAGGLGSNNGATGKLWLSTNLLWFHPGNIHELIHAFGPGHAENIEGGNAMWPGNPTGGADPYYFMGSEGSAQLQADLPSWMKYWMNWLAPSNIITQDTDPSCASVHRIYKHSDRSSLESNKKVSIQLGDELYISYEPDTYNNKITKTGVLLHYLPTQSPAVTRLLDTSPGSSSAADPLNDLWDAAMAVGEEVEWEGTSIRVLGEGGSGQDKWVDIEICGTGNGGESCDVQVLEQFDYSANTSVNGANGGSGFANAWSQDAMNGSVTVLSGSLNYAGVQSAGNKIRLSLQNENGTKGIERNLEQAYQLSDGVWMSCLINPISVPDGGFWIKPNGRQDIAIGKRWGTEIAIDNNGTGINVQANTVYKLVVRYKIENGQTVAHLWVNRNDDFTDANANATKTVSIISELSSIEVRMEKYGNGVFEFDEFYIGCNPEPSDCLATINPGTISGGGTVCNSGGSFSGTHASGTYNIEYSWQNREKCGGSYNTWQTTSDTSPFFGIGPFSEQEQQWRRGARLAGCNASWTYSNVVTFVNTCPVSACSDCNATINPGTITGGGNVCNSGGSFTGANASGADNIEYSWQNRVWCAGSYSTWNTTADTSPFFGIGPFSEQEQQWRRGARPVGCDAPWTYSNVVTFVNTCPIDACSDCNATINPGTITGGGIVCYAGGSFSGTNASGADNLEYSWQNRVMCAGSYSTWNTTADTSPFFGIGPFGEQEQQWRRGARPTECDAPWSYSNVVTFVNTCPVSICVCDINASCDDGDVCTTGDGYDADCNCAGIFQDEDNDGICDANDICNGFDDNVDTDGNGIPDACEGCVDTIVQDNFQIIQVDTSANISIYTNGRVVQSSNILFTAGEEIELMQGFEVQSGAVFHAVIEQCSN